MDQCYYASAWNVQLQGNNKLYTRETLHLMPQHGMYYLKVTKNYTQEKPNKWTSVHMPQYRMFKC